MPDEGTKRDNPRDNILHGRVRNRIEVLILFLPTYLIAELLGVRTRTAIGILALFGIFFACYGCLCLAKRIIKSIYPARFK